MATLSATEILQDTLDSLKVQFPMLVSPAGFATDFKPTRACKGDHVIAHINVNPTAQDYDATTGYVNGATEASALLADVDITMDQLKHVPVKIDYLDQAASQKNLYAKRIGDMAYVLGKAVVDAALATVVAANFSQTTTESNANTSKDTLNKVAKALNSRGASRFNRFGVVSSDFYNKLEEDARIASGDYHGQMRRSDGIGSLFGVSGFARIDEYPGLPTTGNLSAFFGVPGAITIAARLPSDPVDIASSAGIPVPARFTTQTDPQSGLSLLGIEWCAVGTFDLYLTVAILYGVKGGNTTPGTGCDYLGHWVKTA